MGIVLRKVQKMDWMGSITVLLIFVDLAARLSAKEFTQPIFYDSLVTLAVGYWFGKK